MIDHIGAFVDEAHAQADPVWSEYYIPPTGGENPLPGGWNQAYCIADLLIWDPADDTTETIDTSEGPIEAVTHHPYDGKWRVVVTLPEQSLALSASLNCELVADHNTGIAIASTLSPQEMSTLMMQPVFSGSQYPFLEGEIGLTR